MEFLRELLLLDEAKKPKVSKKTAKSVYRRDYLKTKDKPYRKYDAEEHHSSGDE